MRPTSGALSTPPATLAMTPAALTLSPQETFAATTLREIAPVISEGVTCALRDQPADPAGYLAEFMAGRSQEAQRVVDQRKMDQECARLDGEIAALKEQLEAARQEKARRNPSANEAEAARDASVAAASWAEARRIKKLTRSIKVKLSEPLSASDWPLPEGVLLVQAAAGLGARGLCTQLAADFGIGFVEAAEGYSTPFDVLGTVLDVLRRRPMHAVLLEGYLNRRFHVHEQLAEFDRRVGPPTAMLILQCEHDTHVRRLQEDAAVTGRQLTQPACEAMVSEWERETVPHLEECAAELAIPVMRVTVDGDINEQMTSLLLAVSTVG